MNLDGIGAGVELSATVGRGAGAELEEAVETGGTAGSVGPGGSAGS